MTFGFQHSEALRSFREAVRLERKSWPRSIARTHELDPNHAGAAHHCRIHAVEAFRPEFGVESADRLGTSMPGAGHLAHMPAHIYMRVGRYGDSYDANRPYSQVRATSPNVARKGFIRWVTTRTTFISCRGLRCFKGAAQRQSRQRERLPPRLKKCRRTARGAL